jgi:hypothetical protein
MPFRPGVDDDEGLQSLIAVWRDGSADLDSRLALVERRIMATLAGSEIDANTVYRLGLQRERLQELRGVAGNIIDDLTTSTEKFLQGGGMDRIYAAGGAVAHQAAGSLPFSFTAPPRAAVDVLSADVFDDVLQATSFVEDGLKDYVRRVGRALTGFRLTGGIPVKTQARGLRDQLRAEFGRHGATAVTYRDGSRHSFGQYAEMLLRTKTGVAYNMGTLNSSRLLGIEVFEILDGAECGLVAHHDPELANGRIVSLEFAIAYPLAHPNCRRAIAPRPDLKGVNDPDFQSVQAPEARDDQAAFEKALRQQQEARQANGRRSRAQREPRGSRSAGGGSRAARAPRAARGTPAARPGAVGADRLRRREYVQRTKAQAAEARQAERLSAARQRAKVAGFRGEVDQDLLRRWSITEEQFLNARAIVGDIKADVRGAAKAEADNLGAWLFNNDLAQLSRPERLVRRTDMISGQTRFARTQSGYDWLEQLDDAEAARIRMRMVDSDLYTPDVMAGVVRSKTNLDLSDDEAMNWLVDRWLQEDGLRSVASGRLPRYAEPNNLLPADQALEGYRLDQLFGVDVDDAAGHVATVQAEAAAREAASLLGSPTVGPAPWEMQFPEFLRDLEQVEDILGRTQLAPGVDPGEAFAYARARIQELAPPGIDPDGNLNPVELFERIRITAQSAGLPTGG